jgi:phosphoribosylglycinamide formyltransferase 1
VPYRVAVAVSGRGSNLKSLLRRLGPDEPAEVVLVVSNRREAGALALARAHGVATAVLEDPTDVGAWEAVLTAHRVELLVLAGYLRRIPSEIVQAHAGRIINIHPALLPRHGGPGMYGMRVHAAVLAAGEVESGATVHVVTEEYDRGPILAQARVPVQPGDGPEDLAARVLEVEHRLLPEAVLRAAAAGAPVPFAFELETSA